MSSTAVERAPRGGRARLRPTVDVGPYTGRHACAPSLARPARASRSLRSRAPSRCARRRRERGCQQGAPLLQRAPRRRRRSAARLDAVATHRLPDACSSRSCIPAAAGSRSPSTRRPAKDAAALVEQSTPRAGRAGADRSTASSPGPHDGVQVDARAARRNQALRQLYLVRALDGGRDGKQAVVVTLATPAADARRRDRPVRLGARPPRRSRRPFGPTQADGQARRRRAERRARCSAASSVAAPTNVSGSSPRNRRAERRQRVGADVVGGGRPYGAPMYFHIFFHQRTGPLSTQPSRRSRGVAVEPDVHVIVVGLGVARLLHDERRARHQRRIVARRASPRAAAPPPARGG